MYIRPMSIFIIAEIGINHNGDIKLCKKLIDIAVESGCNAVKFQKRDIDMVYTKEFLDSSRESPWGSTQREQKKGLEFGKKIMMKLILTAMIKILNGLRHLGMLIV